MFLYFGSILVCSSPIFLINLYNSISKVSLFRDCLFFSISNIFWLNFLSEIFPNRFLCLFGNSVFRNSKSSINCFSVKFCALILEIDSRNKRRIYEILIRTICNIWSFIFLIVSLKTIEIRVLLHNFHILY